MCVCLYIYIKYFNTSLTTIYLVELVFIIYHNKNLQGSNPSFNNFKEKNTLQCCKTQEKTTKFPSTTAATCIFSSMINIYHLILTLYYLYETILEKSHGCRGIPPLNKFS